MIAIRGEIEDVVDRQGRSEGQRAEERAAHRGGVAATDWTHPYTREQGAFRCRWSGSDKFWPAVGRIDNPYGDRNLFCSCPPIES